MTDDSILRIRQVCHKVGLGRTTIWAYVRTGRFPASVQLAGNRVGWRCSEVQRWIDERPSSRSGAVVLRAAVLTQAAPASVSTPPIAESPPPTKPKPKAKKKAARRDPAEQCSFSFD